MLESVLFLYYYTYIISSRYEEGKLRSTLTPLGFQYFGMLDDTLYTPPYEQKKKKISHA